jgi:hypothetical protein
MEIEAQVYMYKGMEFEVSPCTIVEGSNRTLSKSGPNLESCLPFYETILDPIRLWSVSRTWEKVGVAS